VQCEDWTGPLASQPVQVPSGTFSPAKSSRQVGGERVVVGLGVLLVGALLGLDVVGVPVGLDVEVGVPAGLDVGVPAGLVGVELGVELGEELGVELGEELGVELGVPTVNDRTGDNECHTLSTS
jgi:hypothetical protein